MNIIKCYVTKFIANPSDEDDSDFEEIRRLLGAQEGNEKEWRINPEEEKELQLMPGPGVREISDIPRNSLMAIPVGPLEEVEDTSHVILCRPFFSSHFSLPVKEGEVVWVFSETGWSDSVFSKKWTTDGPCYWITRVHGSIISEDVNYSHYDRQYEKINLNMSSDAAGKDPGKTLMEKYKPSYESQMFDDESGQEIVKNTAGWTDNEAVPRYTKREGDLVIQGSNNTLISLGHGIDAPRPEIDDPETAYGVNPDIPGAAAFSSYGESLRSSYEGAIDIVVGRGTGREYMSDDQIIRYPVRGQPSIINNAAGHEETNKNPTQFETGEEKVLDHPRMYNPLEGWPDLTYDASRVYLARDTNIDGDLEIPLISANTFYPEGHDEPGKEAGNVDKIDDIAPIYLESYGPAIAVKSKNIRVVARSIEAEEREAHPDGKSPVKLLGEQGSIVLLKEGILDPPFDPEADYKPIAEHASKKGNGRAVIALGADGAIYIDGPRIVIGSGQDKDIEHGMGEQIIFGLEAKEPVVMGDTLNNTLEAFMIEVRDFITKTFANHSHATGTGPAGPPGTGSDATTPDDIDAHKVGIDFDIEELPKHLSKIAKTK